MAKSIVGLSLLMSGCAQPQPTAIWLAGPLALGALAEHSDGSSRHRVLT